MNDRVPTVIASVVTTVWVVSVALDAVITSYDPPASVHALMMAAAGWAFGEHVLRHRQNGDRDR